MAEYISTDCLWKCETCFYHRGGKCSTWCDAGESYRPAYSALKSFAIEAEPVKHGRWMERSDGFRCSECKKQPGLHPTKRGVFLSRYCPNCGAKMDLEATDEQS